MLLGRDNSKIFFEFLQIGVAHLIKIRNQVENHNQIFSKA